MNPIQPVQPIKRNVPASKRLSCPCLTSRRGFLARCGGCAAAAVAGGSALQLWAQAAETPANNRPRVRLVFACWAEVQDRPTWPHIGHDMRPEIERVTKTLRAQCPEVEFLPALAHSPDDARKILAQGEAERIDGYLVYQMNNWVQVFPEIVSSGKPTLVADFTYAGSGGFLRYSAGLRNAGKGNFSVVSSSDIEDLVAGARCFKVLRTGDSAAFVAACDRVRRERTPGAGAADWKEDPVEPAAVGECLAGMKKARIVCVGGGSRGAADAIRENLGITVHLVEFEELAAAAAEVDEDQAAEIAAQWRAAATTVKIDEPEETLRKSAANYLAQAALLAKYQAEAITINCLGGFYSGKLKAYPCLGYVELLGSGRVGACEADLRSTATMVAMNHLVRRPGYISDPVVDTSHRWIVYAHCVATIKPFGPEGPANPFEILTHSEDRRGASVRSLLPLGYLTSTMEIDASRREILFHQGKAAENVASDRACRTKLACEVTGDMEKLLLSPYWGSYGWHRVTFYGDLRDPVKELAEALKFKFIEEA